MGRRCLWGRRRSPPPPPQQQFVPPFDTTQPSAPVFHSHPSFVEGVPPDSPAYRTVDTPTKRNHGQARSSFKSSFTLLNRTFFCFFVYIEEPSLRHCVACTPFVKFSLPRKRRHTPTTHQRWYGWSPRYGMC